MDEIILRIFFTVFVIGVFSASAVFRRRANKAGDKLNRKKEGIVILVARSVFGIFILFFLLSYIIYPELVKWSRLNLPVCLRYSGVGLALIISPLVLWMFKSLGKNITDTVDTRKEHELVTSGIYKYIRHPLYTLGTIFYFSLFLITESWIFLLLAVFSFIVIGIIRTKKEENELIEKFGREYIEYRERTGKFFPRICIKNEKK